MGWEASPLGNRIRDKVKFCPSNPPGTSSRGALPLSALRGLGDGSELLGAIRDCCAEGTDSGIPSLIEGSPWGVTCLALPSRKMTEIGSMIELEGLPSYGTLSARIPKSPTPFSKGISEWLLFESLILVLTFLATRRTHPVPNALGTVRFL